ncbi:hypothetical protein LTR60_001556 [Cryomyces antarcticus]|nr:hypothetical protein LTR60_001556 [Cryomyces antarcticus]
MSTIKDPREIGAPEPQDFQAAYILTLFSKDCHANDLSEARLRAFDRSGEPPQFTEPAAQRPPSDHRTTPKKRTKRIYPSPNSDTSGLPGQAQDFKSHPQSPDPLTNAPQQQQQSPLLSRASSFDSGFLLTTQMEQFRAPGRANRSGRTQIDHDVFEGLPVRQWRELEATVTAGPTIGQDNNLTPLKGAWPELPMPRDAHMLSPMSQQLLRAARAGRVYRPSTAPSADPDDQKENADEEEKPEERGFVVRKWTPLPRHLEQPEPVFLAKRRKGLPSAHGGGIAAAPDSLAGLTVVGAPTRKTKVRKTDEAGNVTVWEVIVPEGQTVEGEIIEEAAVVEVPPVAAAAPGTVIEGVGVVNSDGVVVASELLQPAPQRRRPPPPKRKGKKSGPGRKKRVTFSGAVGMTDLSSTGTVTLSSTAQLTSSDGIKLDGAAEGVVSETQGDTRMVDAEEVDEDEGEGSDDGEEGEEGSDDDREEGELSEEEGVQDPTRPNAQPARHDAAPPSLPPPTIDAAPTAALPPSLPPKPASPAPPPKPASSLLPPKPPSPARDPSSSPEMPLARTEHGHQSSLNDPSLTQPPAAADAAAAAATAAAAAATIESQHDLEDGEISPDLFGSLERHLEDERHEA